MEQIKNSKGDHVVIKCKEEEEILGKIKSVMMMKQFTKEGCEKCWVNECICEACREGQTEEISFIHTILVKLLKGEWLEEEEFEYVFDALTEPWC